MSSSNENWELFGDVERGAASNRSCWRALFGDDDTASTHAPSDEGRISNMGLPHGLDPQASRLSERARVEGNATREGALPRTDQQRRHDEWGDFARAYFTLGLLPLYKSIQDWNKPPEERAEEEEEKEAEKPECTLVTWIATLGSLCTIAALVFVILAAMDIWPGDDDNDSPPPPKLPQLEVEASHDRK